MGKYDELRRIAAKPTSQSTADNIEAYKAAVTPVSAPESSDLGSKYDFLRNPQKYIEQNKINEAQKTAETKAFSKKLLNDTLASVIKPVTTQPEAPTPSAGIDFKAAQAADLAAKNDPFVGKTLAPINSTPNTIQQALQGKVPAASLLQQTGRGPANASQIPGLSQYETTKKEIANDNVPEAVKAYANVMNYITQGNPLGQAVSRSFAGNSGVTRRDSTGNKTVDKITDLVNDLVTPFITPTGAPLGKGIVGGSYDATAQALSGKAGQTLLKGAGKIIPGSPNVVKNAATEGIAGAIQGVGFGLQQGQDSGNELARNALWGIAGGAVLAGGGTALGEVLGKVFNRVPKAVETTVKNTPYEGLTREQRIYRQYLDDVPLSKEDMDFMLSPEWNESNLLTKPVETPVKQTAETPFAEIQAEPVNVAAEAPIPARAVVETPKAEIKPKTELKPKTETTPKADTSPKVKSAIAKLDEELKAYKDIRDQQVASGYLDKEQASKQIKGRAMEIAAQKREIIQGESLITVEGGLTYKELQTKVNRLKSNYKGKPVIAGGAEGKIKSNAFGKVVVEFPDGTTKAFDPEDVIPKTDVNALIAKQTEAKNAVNPKTELKPKTEIKPVNSEVASTLELAPVKTELPSVKAEMPTTPKKKYKQGERGFKETLDRSYKTPDEFTDDLSTKYEPTTNRGDLAKAEERIKDRAGATRFILEDTKGGMTSEQSITAQRLMDTHLKEGNIKAAEEVADALLKESTRSAQFLQSLSVYNKLSPEGVYMVAKRYANKINETSSKLAKKAEVTAQMADDLQGLATINQKMTGVKDLSNDAVDILKRAKAGEKLTDAETSVIQKFVDESRQFIKETEKTPKAPRAPKVPKDKKVKESVIKFLDAQEAAAKERLRKKGVRVSSTPLDIWADYAVIGAAKMGRGVVEFADWSAEMVKAFGEDITPQLRNLYEKSVEAFELSSKKVTSKSFNTAEKLTQKLINTKQLNEQEANSLLKLASQVDELSGEAKRVASQDLQVILQSLDQPSLGKKISSIQTQAQLLNPKTQVRNVLGNELFYRLERISKYISTPIDIAQSKLTGSERTVTFKTHNQGKYWENFINGGNAGWRGVNINGIETQYDLASPAFKGKYNPFKYTEKVLGAALRSFDNAAYSRAVNKTLGELGTLDAINNGVKPSKSYVEEFIRKADENIMKIATDYGKYVTFQDNNLLSQGLTKFKRGLNFGKDFGLGDLIIKYPKTPGALLMRALEYSPAGFLRSAKIIAEPLLKNGIDKNPREAVEALSRAIVGTGGLSMLGYYLMDKDIITGAASGDKDIRSLQSKTGRGAYQVNLSALYRFVKSGFDPKESAIKEGDQLYNYDWMQPLSIAISLGANVKGNQSKDSSNIASGALGVAYNSAAGALNTLTQQSVLQGVESALSGYTGQTSTDKIISIIADMPSSFVPTFSNQNKQLQDNAKRETYAPTIGEKTLNTVKAKIPGLAETLPKKYDTLGQEQTHYQDNNAFNVFANPGFPAKYKLSDEARKIVDLIAATGDETLAPRVPGKTINGMKLSGKEYSRFSQLQGEETKRLVSELDTSLSVEDQADEMEKILREAAKTAKEKMLEEFPRLGE